MINCPSCGAALTLRSAAQVYSTCSYCQSLVLHSALGVEDLGKVAVLPFDMSPIRLGTRLRVEQDRFHVVGRVRWGWLLRVTAVAFALYGVVIVGGLALGLGGDVAAPSLADDAVLYGVIALALVPVQATAEEYVFRGYLFQLVGSWTRFAIVPVLSA